MKAWNNKEEFEEIFSDIKDALYADDFFKLTGIDDVPTYLKYLRKRLLDADEMDMLSKHLQSALMDYRKNEVTTTLDALSDKGLVRMVVRDDGKLGYELTDNGKSIGEEIARHRMGLHNDVPQEPKYHYDYAVFRCETLQGGFRFVDHGDNFEYIIIPAGKKHSGEEYVQYYHTIYTDYHDVGPNGEYKLIDETQLNNFLNPNN